MHFAHMSTNPKPNTNPETLAPGEHPIFGKVIYTYSRRQAIADGMLIDVTETAREAGVTFPVAITAAAWADCVAWDADTEARKGCTGNSERGRLWDVVWMFRTFAKAARGSVINFALYRIPREGRGTRARKVYLKAVCGPGDTAEPVVTIMLPNED